MKKSRKQVNTPVFTNKNFLICNICGIHLEEGEDVCGNGHEVEKDSPASISSEKIRKSFFSNQL